MAIRRTEARTTGSFKPLQKPTPSKSNAALQQPDAFAAKAQPAGTTAAAAEPTKLPHHWAAPLRETALRTGAQLKDAGKLLHQGADALELTDPLGLEAHTLGAQANALGAQVESLSEAPRVPAGTVHAEADHLEKRAKGLLARALEEAANGRRVVKQGLDQIGKGADAVGEAVKTYTKGIAQAVEYRRNIDQLGEGDSYRLGLEAFIALAGAEVQGAGALEVAREKDRYTVSIDGELAGGIWAELGFHVLGAAADAHVALLGGLGNKLEVAFATADEAKRAVELMLSRIAKTATLRRFTPEEAALFEQHLSAVELRGHVVAEAFAMMGLKGAVAAMGELDVRAEHAVRVELGDEPALVMTETLSASLYGGAGLSPENEVGVLGLAMLGPFHGEAAVELESRFPLAKGIDLSAFQREPVKALRALKQQTSKTGAETTAKLSFEGKGGVMGSGGGFGLELSLKTGAGALTQSGAIGRVLRGDFAGALEQLPPASEVDGKLERFADYGVDLGPAVYFMSFGAGFELEAMRKDVDFEHVKRSRTKVEEVAATISKWMKGLLS